MSDEVKGKGKTGPKGKTKGPDAGPKGKTGGESPPPVPDNPQQTRETLVPRVGSDDVRVNLTGQNRPGSRAAVINEVLLASDKPLTTNEVEMLARKSQGGRDYFNRTTREIGGVGSHLAHLARYGLIVRVAGGWGVVGIHCYSNGVRIETPAPTKKGKGKK